MPPACAPGSCRACSENAHGRHHGRSRAGPPAAASAPGSAAGSARTPRAGGGRRLRHRTGNPPARCRRRPTPRSARRIRRTRTRRSASWLIVNGRADPPIATAIIPGRPRPPSRSGRWTAPVGRPRNKQPTDRLVSRRELERDAALTRAHHSDATDHPGRHRSRGRQPLPSPPCGRSRIPARRPRRRRRRLRSSRGRRPLRPRRRDRSCLLAGGGGRPSPPLRRPHERRRAPRGPHRGNRPRRRRLLAAPAADDPRRRVRPDRSTGRDRRHHGAGRDAGPRDRRALPDGSLRRARGSRAAYHAAAAIASNFLVALENSAAELLAAAGSRTVASCSRRSSCGPRPTGPSAGAAALTGPIAARRATEEAVARHLGKAIAEAAPELESLCRALRRAARVDRRGGRTP